MHYCTLDEIKQVFPLGNRFNEFGDTARESVTAAFNAYINRDLSYAQNVVESFDMITLSYGVPYRVYLSRRNIVAGSVSLSFLGSNSYIDTPRSELDAAAGKLTVYGPSRFASGGLAVTYSGGYAARLKPGAQPPYQEADLLDAMDCPAELRLAAIRQASKILQNVINQSDGNTQEQKGRAVLAKERTIGGLIPEVATVLNQYRRTRSRVI